MMEFSIAKKIRENWGNKPCDHPKIVREFFGDTFTLDFVCTQCGAEFNILEMLEVKDRKRQARKPKSNVAA